MTVLLDANVLIALLVDDHVHHQAAENWFVGMTGNFATCPITQGSLMRLLIREGQPAAAAQGVLSGTTADPRHEFWPGDIQYTDVPVQGIIGHRQVTDAYLAQLARAHRSRLATFDRGLAKQHHDVEGDRKSTRLNSSHLGISYAVFCLKKKKKKKQEQITKKKKKKKQKKKNRQKNK